MEEFDWNPTRPYALLNDVYRLVAQWLLQPSDSMIRAELSIVSGHSSHPIPDGCVMQGLVEVWADEVGRLLFCHDQLCSNGYCIGIACSRAFGGETLGSYGRIEAPRAFPLVGPEDIGKLEDAYEWVIPNDIHRRVVSLKDACTHVDVLGSVGIDKPPGGSHYKVKFRNARPWPLDRNIDPIPDRHLRELIEITGFPLHVIKTALIEGRLPRQRLRIPALEGRQPVVS